MRTINAQMEESLTGQATTLCRCWRMTRQDGAILGFTDHDGDLSFSGVVFHAASGLDAAEAEQSLGLAAGGGDVHGALIDDAIMENDLDGGVYDNASVEIWLVDWSNPERRLLLDIAQIGEVRRTEFAFAAELRSLAHHFDQDRGRQFQKGCSAELGDEECAVDLSSPKYSCDANVAAIEASGAILFQLNQTFENGFFDQGVMIIKSSGRKCSIKSHSVLGQTHRIVLWSPLDVQVLKNATVALTAGCDKKHSTCSKKFENVVNFRGFPHIPGNDVLMSTPLSAGAFPFGWSLFK